jgi:hypothetical protein
MPEPWTGDVVSALHVHRKTRMQLAEKMGINDKYLLSILNGHRNPPNAEERVKAALDELLKEEW